MFLKQITVESGWQIDVGSSAGAQGIAQIVPKWHPAVNPWNPWDSLHYAANLMGEYLREYDGDYTLALIRYNGGFGAIAAWQNGRPYKESQDYVKWILG